jgi:hypothetical protein
MSIIVTTTTLYDMQRWKNVKVAQYVTENFFSKRPHTDL